MTTSRNSAAHIRNGGKAPTSPASPASGARASTGRRTPAARRGRARRRGAHRGGCPHRGGARHGNAAVLTNCAATPSSCGYPGATNTGVPSGTALKSVPGQVSSGPGWYYNAAGNAVIVTGKGRCSAAFTFPTTSGSTPPT